MSLNDHPLLQVFAPGPTHWCVERQAMQPAPVRCDPALGPDAAKVFMWRQSYSWCNEVCRALAKCRLVIDTPTAKVSYNFKEVCANTDALMWSDTIRHDEGITITTNSINVCVLPRELDVELMPVNIFTDVRDLRETLKEQGVPAQKISSAIKGARFVPNKWSPVRTIRSLGLLPTLFTVRETEPDKSQHLSRMIRDLDTGGEELQCDIATELNWGASVVPYHHAICGRFVAPDGLADKTRARVDKWVLRDLQSEMLAWNEQVTDEDAPAETDDVDEDID